CVKNVVLEVVREDGEIDRTTLTGDLVLRKEVGNARLVSGDSMLWVGKSVLAHKDATVDSTPTRTVRVENGKRRFVFTVGLDVAGKQFCAELKDQVDGKAGVEIRKKKRKIRKQLSQAMGFTPVNTLKSPAKKPPTTPKRSPLASIRSPQLSLPPPLPLKTASGAPTSFPSPSRSPFRSPFRKKARHSLSPSSAGTSVLEPTTPSSRSPAREWLSPVRSLKLRSGPTPPDLKRNGNHALENSNGADDASNEEDHRRKSITGTLNKRVRSLQLLLDDEPSKNTPPKSVERQQKTVVVSRFFQKKTPSGSPSQVLAPKALDMSMESAVTDTTEQPDDEIATEELDRVDDDSNTATSADGPHRSTHGLLNLGNYCYMNAIIQALASLPAFVSGVQSEENLLKIIRKQPYTSAKSKTLEQLKVTFDTWRTSGGTKHLALQYALDQLLQQVIKGSETSINPEPLKNVMGRKNAIFATYDAHEFLLNLVTEYEKELVKTVHEVTEKVLEESKTSPQTPKSRLLNFFRSVPKGDETQQVKKAPTADGDLELICQLPPAKCFRAELNRTLTCRNCGYSRKQAETFYDFSLDLPYYPIPEQEPTAEQEPQEPSAERQCFCNLAAIVQDNGNERFYCCPKATCSFREKLVESEEVKATPPTQDPDVAMRSSPSPSPAWPTRPSSIDLDTLIQKQFEPEILELTCEKCKVGKEAESAYEVKSLPSVLVLHLKRFEVNPHTGALYKRCDPIVPPIAIDPIHAINNTLPSGNEAAYKLKVSEDYALRAYRSQESCYMMFYVKSELDDINEGKENVPLNLAPSRDENDENASQQQQGGRDTGLRAFL
ncbi:hypothetical protein BBJ28_00015003, partial [Nothophytophthora sp. Chile5]